MQGPVDMEADEKTQGLVESAGSGSGSGKLKPNRVYLMRRIFPRIRFEMEKIKKTLIKNRI